MEEEKNVSQKNYSVAVSIVLAAVIIGGAFYMGSGKNKKGADGGQSASAQISQNGTDVGSDFELSEKVVLPVKWGDLGQKMISAGVIDPDKLEAVYKTRGGLSADGKALLYASNNGDLQITKDNSDEILNLLWALGLGNKNEILDKGEMKDSRYGGAGNFASTGGWTIAKGSAMDHYSMHPFVVLTKEQQDLVDRVSKGIYRPCCNNSTHFPDCNHGMAMLGLLELMASQGVSENDMYKTALVVNLYWFPEQYETIARYFGQKGISWSSASAKEVLGADFSSGSGYQQVLSKTAPLPSDKKGGGGCSV